MKLLDLNPLFPGPAGGEPEPGMATFFGGKWVFGARALETCRLDPQSTCPLLWEELNLNKTRNDESRALLAVRDLRARMAETEGPWVALCPDAWSKASLQVFLGVAKECGLDVRILLSRAVAVASLAGMDGESTTVLEWSWNDLRRVRVGRSEDGLTFEDAERVSGGGVFDLYRRDAALASEFCLREFRVDPLDTGPLDQRLFNGWWNWRTRGTPWIFTHDRRELRLSDQRERFDQAQREWFGQSGLKDSPDLVVPVPLRNPLGLEQARAEPDGLRRVLSRFEEPLPKGSRWKGSLPAVLPSSESETVEKPVTHMVVDGIAERVSGPVSAKPGERLTLDNGREALAVHVPEA